MKMCKINIFCKNVINLADWKNFQGRELATPGLNTVLGPLLIQKTANKSI